MIVENWFKILNVSEDVDLNTVKKRFKELALIHHPDKNGGIDTQFKQILEAYLYKINSPDYKFSDNYPTFKENDLALYSLEYFYILRLLNVKITYKILKEYCKLHHILPFNVKKETCIDMIFLRISPEKILEKNKYFTNKCARQK